ncbi:MAG: hypothetical protein KF890_10925 [Nitrospira sp.]|nr:hypothetical protein [Nitrospira sp.]
MKPKNIIEDITTVRRYTVKFVCGSSDGSVLAKGDYFTAITIHNARSQEIRFRRKAIFSVPGEKPSFASEFTFGSLGPDAIVEISCAKICKEVDLPQDSIHKGLFILESPAELDVAAIHTAAGAGGHVVMFKYDDITPRLIKLSELERPPSRPLPDLIPLPPFPPPSRKNQQKLPQNYCCSSVGDATAHTVRIIVRNQGKGDAPASMTAVRFKGRKPVHIETPAIPAGDKTTVEVRIPEKCLAEKGGCLFEITVNATGAFDESSKENNKARGSCPC